MNPAEPSSPESQKKTKAPFLLLRSIYYELPSTASPTTAAGGESESEPVEDDEPPMADSPAGDAEASSVARVLSLLDTLDVAAEISGATTVICSDTG